MTTPIPGLEAAGEPGPGAADLFLLRDAPAPWLPASLPLALLDEVADQMYRFVAWLNGGYAVNDDQLIPACWPDHPGLINDLAALWATWIEAYQGLGATAEKALDFHERRLPAFYGRLGPQLGGRNADRCSPAGHKKNWRPTEPRLTPAERSARPPLLERPGSD